MTASSIATSAGTSPRSSSVIATRSALRSTTPSRSAVQPSDAAVMRASSSAAVRGRLLGELARPRVDLAGVLRADLAPGEIPLVEQEQRLPAGLAARDHHASSSTATSTGDVEPAHRLQRRGDGLLRALAPARRAARRAAAASSSRTTPRLDVDRAPAPHADAVDALGGPHGDLEQHRVGHRDRAVRAVERERHRPGTLRDGRTAARRASRSSSCRSRTPSLRRITPSAKLARRRHALDHASPRARARRARAPPAGRRPRRSSFASSES